MIDFIYTYGISEALFMKKIKKKFYSTLKSFKYFPQTSVVKACISCLLEVHQLLQNVMAENNNYSLFLWVPVSQDPRCILLGACDSRSLKATV